MGIYYLAANHTAKQYIDPGKVGGGAIKRLSLISGDLPKLLVHAMMSDWLGHTVVMVGDTGDTYHEVEDEYKDVTKAAIDNYNSEMDPDEKIDYTGR